MQRLYSKPVTNVNTVNISVIGMNGSGKSAVVVKYLTRRFIVEYAPYLSDSYTKIDCVDGHELTVNIQDTSDSDDIDLDDIIKWSQAIIILFSMTSRRSFYRAQELVEAVHLQCELFDRKPKLSGSQASKSNVPSQFTSSLTGSSVNISSSNPASTNTQNSLIQSGSLRRSALFTINTAKPPSLLLVANKLDLERFRLVQKTEAEEFAKSHGIPYFEITVADTYKEVQTIFHAAARLYLQSKGIKPRQTNGQPISGGRGILPSGNPPSVLTSLAVSPSLLLQKKSTTTSPFSSESIACTEAEPTPVVGVPTSILSNLRLRAASPTSTTSAVKPPSSARFPNPQTSPPSKQSVLSNSQPPQPASTQSHSTAQNPTTTHSTSNIPTTNILSRKAPSIGGKSSQPQSEQRTPSSVSPGNVSVTTTAPGKQPIRNPAPPPIPPPKKNPIGFKFFSKRK